MNHKIKKIAILCQYEFPEGMAPTIRILSYSKGLVQNGINVEVNTFTWRRDDSKYPESGITQGVKYKVAHSWNTKKGKLHKVFIDKFLMSYKAIKHIVESHRKERIDYVLLSFDHIPYLFRFVPILRLFGIKCLFIGDEFPEAIRQLKNKVPWYQILQYKLIYTLIDGRILMTNALKKFYDEKISKKPTFIMCSILNTDRFLNLQRQKVARPYLCYMGNMMLAKDNVDNIINAYSLICDQYPNLDLYLFGNPNEKDKSILKDLVSQKQLENRVFFKGRVDYGQVPQILVNAKILVTSQPITKRAEGGFPTKMAEYMMSKTPMLVTNVGEIHKYVQDGINCYMVEPCNSKLYADKLSYILNNYEEADKVAGRAYDYACRNFRAKEVTSELIDFLSDLKK